MSDFLMHNNHNDINERNKDTQINPNLSNNNSSVGNMSSTTINPKASRGNKDDTMINPNVSETESTHQILHVGEIVNNKFLITGKMVHFGAEAELYICKYNNEEFCLKIYKESVHVRKEVRSTLQNKIKSKYISKIVDYGYHNDNFYEVFILYKGKNFSELLSHKRFNEVTINSFVGQMNEALADLHRNGLIHQDIKPANIVLNDRDIVLIDFGVAAFCEDLNDSGGRTHVTKVGNTTEYSAPEVLLGEYCWPASDYYSLGVTVYELFMGHTPYAFYDKNLVMQRIEDMRLTIIPELDSFPLPIQDLLVGLLQYDYSKRWGYKEVNAWVYGDYYKYIIKRNNNHRTLKFLNKDYEIPSQIDELIISMAYNWRDGLDMFDENGRFIRLRNLVENFDGLDDIYKICNSEWDKSNRDKCFLIKLHNLSSRITFFTWRGFVAENPQKLGDAILRCLWKNSSKSIAKEQGLSNIIDFDSFNNVTADLSFESLHVMIENELFTKHYLDRVNKPLSNKILQIIKNTDIEKEEELLYYRIGYAMSGTTELHLGGKAYSNKEHFIEELKSIYHRCEANGNNLEFYDLCSMIYNNDNVDFGFIAWTESIGHQSEMQQALELLRRCKN